MPGLPKIAFARLKANSEASKPPGSPLEQEASQGAKHPDANLIAAFAEKTLTETERTQVLNHLSRCAGCREVAAFILPADAVMTEPPRVAAGRRWNPWPVLRWGAMAAVLGVLTIVVVLHPGMWKQNQEISKSTPPPTPAGNVASAPTTVAPLPSVPPPAKTVQANAQMEARKSANEEAQFKKASRPRPDLAMNNQVAHLQAQQHATVMASIRPPATLRAENVPAVSAERKESLGDHALSATGRPAPSLPSAPAGEPIAASGEAGKVTAESVGPGTLHATTQSVAVAGGNPGTAPAQASAAKTAPTAAARAKAQVTAQAPTFEMEAFRKDLKLKAGPPAALWSISSDGKVQRSTDGAKSFQSIDVARGVRFQAIASSDNEVWAGGTGGALYHSIDAGSTWTQIAINIGGNTMTETIAAIHLHDPQHLTVTTTSGSEWVSEDGGQHWQKQP